MAQLLRISNCGASIPSLGIIMHRTHTSSRHVASHTTIKTLIEQQKVKWKREASSATNSRVQQDLIDVLNARVHQLSKWSQKDPKQRHISASSATAVNRTQQSVQDYIDITHVERFVTKLSKDTNYITNYSTSTADVQNVSNLLNLSEKLISHQSKDSLRIFRKPKGLRLPKVQVFPEWSDNVMSFKGQLDRLELDKERLALPKRTKPVTSPEKAKPEKRQKVPKGTKKPNEASVPKKKKTKKVESAAPKKAESAAPKKNVSKELLAAVHAKRKAKVLGSKVAKTSEVPARGKMASAGTSAVSVCSSTLVEDLEPEEVFEESAVIPAELCEEGDEELDLGKLTSMDDMKDITELLKKKMGRKNLSQPSLTDTRMLMYNQDAKAFVDICIQAGLVKKAHAFLVHDSKKPKLSTSLRVLYVRDVAVYNQLLHAWAKKGELDKQKELLSCMSEAGMVLDLQSYAAILECLARQAEFDKALANRVLSDAKKENLDVRDIFNQCKFVKDEREMVLKALTSADGDLCALPPPQLEGYQCDLLQHLNQDNKSHPNPFAGIVLHDELSKGTGQQLAWEIQGSVQIDSIAHREAPCKRDLIMREKLEGVKEGWREMLTQAYKRNLNVLRLKSRGDGHISLYPYLKFFDASVYVELMIQEILELAKGSVYFSPDTGILRASLGRKVYSRFIIQDKINNQLTDKVSEVYHDFMNKYNSETIDGSQREQWCHLLDTHTEGPSLGQPDKHWPYHVIKGIGKFLYNMVMYDTKINANLLRNTEDSHMIPAVYSIFRNSGYQDKEEVKPHPVVVKLVEAAKLPGLTFSTQELPMLVPPIPWTQTGAGGYLLAATDIIRLPGSTPQPKHVLESTPKADLYPLFDSLNTLGSCPWIINKPVLDTIISIFNNKGDKSLDIPPPVTECPPLPRFTNDMSSEEKKLTAQKILKLKAERAELYSLWCTELYRLSIANKFRDEVFWFPNNIDFRGRVYPCPPHFNHLGSDVTRSLLLLAKGKPLGAGGLDWLKIHLINLTGFKKRSSNSERLAFANQMLDNILDSADRPLNGNKWWQKSDEPWQTLACCMEIANASRSHDPSQYISNYPVHQDGSCNGLQHYAALGRDQAGAESVNLHPFETPQDVYSDVAELVEKVRAQDAAMGVPIAKQLEGFVARKVIKQTVMTTVYGVTKFGAKYQIVRQLDDIPSFPKEHSWQGAIYLADKTFQCLQEMFTATKEIQDWFTICANLVSGIRHKPVEWVTPLGLPVLQPYYKTVKASRTPQGSTNLSFEKPNTKKQKNGFPPNFIHSLDSVHMMLTALHCQRAGITFQSVHDCFWTHACDVPVMNKICREQFVALHSQPVLEDLAKYLSDSFGFDESALRGDGSLEDTSMKFVNTVLSRVPTRGNFDLKNVKESTYFFS